MGLFSKFRKHNQEDTVNKTGEQEEISKGFPSGKSSVSINGSKGLDAIYGFLQYDYESRGYNDALTNPDDSYKSDNIKLMNHDLLILIDRSSSYYEDLLKEVEFHISSRNRAGLVDLVEELKTKLQIINDHLQKIKIIKEDAVKGEGSTQRIALSYQRGFMKGLSAISQSKVINNN